MIQKHTIASNEGLEGTQHALGCIERALASLRHDLLPHNPQLYALTSEGYIDDIWKFRAEIDEYLGLTSPTDPQPRQVETFTTGESSSA